MKYCLLLNLLFTLTCTTYSAQAEPPAEPNIGEVHQVGLVDIGYEALLFRLHLIENAKETIEIQTFIWENDECGKAFMQALVDAAQRGVRVRFLMDHYYSDSDMQTMLALTQLSPNLEIRRYRPPRDKLNSGLHTNTLHMALAFRSRNQRMHNKVLIVDDRIAMPGGRNISNHYFDYIADRNYLDRDVLLTGPLVKECKDSFEQYWEYHRSIPLSELKDVQQALTQAELPVWEATPEPEYDEFLQLLYRDLANPARTEKLIQSHMRTVNHAWISVDPPGKNDGVGLLGMQAGSQSANDLMKVMEPATQSILIQSPYMVLDRKSTKFFRRLHRDTPDLQVDLITNSYASTGNMTAYAGAFRTRAKALRFGINVHELKPVPEDLAVFMPPLNIEQEPFDKFSVHAKTLVVDSLTAYVGSYNLDPRSMHLNTELGIVIEDAAFAQELEQKIRLSLEPGNSWRVGYRDGPLNAANRKIERVSQHLPLDVWPVSSTALFEGDESIGVLPVHDGLSLKRWNFRINKCFGLFTRPLI